MIQLATEQFLLSLERNWIWKCGLQPLPSCQNLEGSPWPASWMICWRHETLCLASWGSQSSALRRLYRQPQEKWQMYDCGGWHHRTHHHASAPVRHSLSSSPVPLAASCEEQFDQRTRTTVGRERTAREKGRAWGKGG